MNKLWIIAFLFNFGTACLFPQNLYNCLTETATIELPFGQFHLNTKQGQYNWGASLNLSGKYSSLIVKSGNLTFSGSASQLSSPALSAAITPFSKVSAAAEHIQTGYQNSESFSKPVSWFAQYSFTAQNQNRILVNGFFSPEEQKGAISLELLWNQTHKTITGQKEEVRKNTWQFSMTAGLFPFTELTAETWFLPQNYYQSGTEPFICFEQSFSTKDFKTVFVENLYLTRYEKPAFTCSNEILWNCQNWSFSLSEYFNYFDQVYSSSQTKLKEVLEIKTNLQHQSKANNITQKQGLTIYSQWDLYNTQHSLGGAAGYSISSKHYSGSLSAVLKATLLPVCDLHIQDFNTKLENTFYLNWCTITLNGSFDLIPPANAKSTITSQKQWTSTQTVNAAIKTRGKLSIKGSISGTFTQKDWKPAKNQLEYSAGLSFSQKWITASITYKDCY